MSKKTKTKREIYFCWHCARKLRKNIDTTFTDTQGHKYVVHVQCKRKLEKGEEVL